MYKKFFGLQENPFNVTPDPRFLYPTPHTEEAMACLTYCVQARKGFALLTGDVGTGKTTLLNKLLEWLKEQQIASAFVFNPRLNPFQFLDYALSDFGVNCQSRLKSVLLTELNNWLLERYRTGSTAVLIVDEAQDASPELLEEIRLLTNLETPSGKLLQIVLAGQQELEMKLRLPEFRQLRQRIMLRAKTHPLTLEETHEYIATRLRVAGSDGRKIFTPEAVDAIRKYSEGIPRIINILCEDALLSAFADQTSIVPREIIEEVAKELELDRYPATAPPHPETKFDDLVQAGVYVNRARPVVPPATPPSGELSGIDEPPVQRRPAHPVRNLDQPVESPLPRQVAPQLIAHKPVQSGPAAEAGPAAAPVERTATWSPAMDPPETVRLLAESTSQGEGEPTPAPGLPRPASATKLEASLSDDDILKTLRQKDAAKAPSPTGTVTPAPKPAATPAPSTTHRPAVTAAPQRAVFRPATNRRALWLGIAAVIVAGASGAIFMGKYFAPSVPAENVPSAPTPSAAVAPAPQPEVMTSTSPEPNAPESHSSVGASDSPPSQASASRPAEITEAQPTPAAPPPVPHARQERPAPVERDPRPAKQLPVAVGAESRPAGAFESSAPKVGKAVVTSSVEGATIMVDGRTSADWVTPFTFPSLPVGVHSILVSKAGYGDVATRLTIREGQTSYFRANLAPSSGEITIVTEPPGFPVSFDGGPFQPTPAQVSLTAGPHKYRIQLPNGRIYEGSVEMKAGSIITRRVDFTGGEWLTPAQ